MRTIFGNNRIIHTIALYSDADACAMHVRLRLRNPARLAEGS